MSADAINQTSNAATYYGLYRVSHSTLNFNDAFFDEFGINAALAGISWAELLICESA